LPYNVHGQKLDGQKLDGQKLDKDWMAAGRCQRAAYYGSHNAI